MTPVAGAGPWGGVSTGLLLRLLIGLKLCLLAALAFNTRFVMDEFWTLSQTTWLWDGFFTTIWPEKSVLYVVFYDLARRIGTDSVSMLLIARAMTAGVAMITCALVWRIARHSGQSALMAALGVMVLLSFSNFMERGFRLRSEPLALLFALLALWVTMRGPADRTGRLILAGIFSGLAFLTTQKSIYFNVALGMALVVDALALRRPASALRRGTLLIGGWLIAVATYVLGFGGMAPLGVLRALFLGPIEVATVAHELYPGIRGFVGQTFVRNIALYIPCLAGLAVMLAGLPRLAPPQRIHAIFTLVMAVLVFTHDQPWPYVFTMVLPVLAICPGHLLTRSREGIGAKVVLMLLVAGISAGFVRNVAYFDHDNRVQLAFIRQAEALVPLGETYFDGIGMLPARRMAPRLWLDAMAVSRANAAGPDGALPNALAEERPELIIQSYRTDAIRPVIAGLVDTRYVHDGEDLLRLRQPGEAPQGGGPSATDLFQSVYD
ncbi:glycosyltransferase family 39 protein [Frigidibacter sp. MR17.14]|uniref:DUF7056 domain-containing protein n=1 Tax=Frigidibacter sp. MR17.14 TaxID=3126509 RepID=UPI00301314DD